MKRSTAIIAGYFPLAIAVFLTLSCSSAPAGGALARAAPSTASPAMAPPPAPTVAPYNKKAEELMPQPAPTADDIKLDVAPGGESYELITENAFMPSGKHPLSTFSIDVDTASYANIRRMIDRGYWPPVDAVRIEEMINYFDYAYPDPDRGPLAVHAETTTCPWAPEHHLLMIGVQGRRVALDKLPPANFVFLLDVSGSMSDPDKLPLLKKAFIMLAEQLRPQDSVAIVVYAGASGVVLPPTSGADKRAIVASLDALESGGSTAGGEGIQLAYELAKKHLKAQGNNRVILATDGDFNVGVTDTTALLELISRYRTDGIYLTVLGFGTGNLQDSRMQSLADKGQGNYAYIDSALEARKVLVTQMGGTLLTIAKDVKIQVEFNPEAVKGYRLIGYENRILATRDFADDTKDAGELGSGHTVTALYEVIPATSSAALPSGADPQAVGDKPTVTDWASGELARVRLRYKTPASETSTLVNSSVAEPVEFKKASNNLRFAAAVAGFGMLLRNSAYKGETTFDQVLDVARAALGPDANGYRAAFIQLVTKTQSLGKRP